MGRHQRSRPQRQARPVFASKSGHRGLIVLLFLVVLAADLVLAANRAGDLAAAAPVSSSLHTSIAYPRLLAGEMAACGRVHGELAAGGQLSIPVIGSGVLERVVHVQRKASTTFAVDPFSGRVVVSQLTPLEIHDTRGCDYAIEQYGDVPSGTLLLTFDGGPDPLWTPKVLAVLRAYGARATFFATGANILRAPAAFRLAISSGNVAGNDTFSDPVFGDLTPAAARSQLVTTSHIIAAVGDYQTRLFRAPDEAPDGAPDEADNGPGDGSVQTEAGVYAVLVAQQLGFTEVGFTAGAFGGPGRPGQVVVMHDTWGRDGAATVRLLARILQKSQALGYRYMTADQLVQQQGQGHPAGPVQPTLGDRLGYWAAWAGDELPQTGLPLLLTGATWLILGFGVIWIVRALYGGWRQHQPVPSWHPKLVSVVIAAKDEKAVIRDTIESVFAYRYPFSLQVVVVNDGSTDGEGGTADGPGGTRAILDQLAGRYRDESRQLEVIHLEKNVGKAAALDLAFRTKIRGEVCAAFDADTRLAGPETIPNLVRHFRDPKVGAVAGHIRAGNITRHPWKWVLFRFQQAEYNLGIGLMRVAQGKHGILIVPGACSAWRTSAMQKVGVPGDTVGEDADAGLELREAGFTVVQDIRAVAVTQAPDTLQGIAKQWTRWTFGTVQNLWKHKKIMVQVGRYGALTWVMWYSALGLLVPVLLMPLNYAVIALAAARGNWPALVMYLAVFTGFRLVQNLTAMVVLREWSWDPLTAVFYRFINDPLQVYLAYRTVFAIATGRLVSWKGTRVARVQSSQLRAA